MFEHIRVRATHYEYLLGNKFTSEWN